jgi:hypothetical protein
MKKQVKQFLTDIGMCLVSRNSEGLFQHFAEWLNEDSRSHFLAQVKSKEADTKQNASDEEVREPGSLELDDNPCRLQELRDDGVPLPTEITESNFVRWCCLSVLSEDEECSFYDLWCAVVRQDGVYKIGYFEINDPD